MAGGADKEIRAKELDTQRFVDEQASYISREVGDGVAINALSGGVDSSVVTLLGHRALGDRLKTYFIDNGIMRKDEPRQVFELFRGLGVPIEVIDARDVFFNALSGISDPEEKREAVRRAFYRDVFGGLVRSSGASVLLQGTILTDIDETVAGIKRQHNVFEQLGIDPLKEFGYRILEPLVRLRKDGVRKVGKALGLPESLFNRPPFPGPALAARVIGPVTREKVELVRAATAITEEILASSGAFQYLAILHQDQVTGMRDGKRKFGSQIEIRCWDSVDARTARPTAVPFETLERLADRIVAQIPEVVSVTYNITRKPPSTMEAI